MVELFSLELQSERLAIIIQNSFRYLEIRKDMITKAYMTWIWTRLVFEPNLSFTRQNYGSLPLIVGCHNTDKNTKDGSPFASYLRMKIIKLI